MASPPFIADDCAAHDAELADLFHIHAALVRAEQGAPHLKNSARWKLMRMDAYEAMMTAWRAY